MVQRGMGRLYPVPPRRQAAPSPVAQSLDAAAWPAGFADTGKKQAMRRRSLLAAPALLRLPLRSQEAWPSKPVRMIVPFPPGQTADLFARIIAEQLSARWSQRVFVENRAGGAGAIGMEAGARAAPDGCTLSIGTCGTLGINPSVMARLPYDPIADFAPVSSILQVPLLLVCQPGQNWQTPADLVAAARANQGAIPYASAGPGSAQHVPYRGSGPAMADLPAGNVPLMMDSLAAALGQVKGARARALAITSAQRSKLLPDVPTLAETVAPGFAAAGWSGLVAPAATPPALVARLSTDPGGAERPNRARQDRGAGRHPRPRLAGAVRRLQPRRERQVEARGRRGGVRLE
jgi:tripartite-type tricarboxylate transporter receptor subunit TctC